MATLTGENRPDTRAEGPGVNVGDGIAKPYITKKASKTTATAGN